MHRRPDFIIIGAMKSATSTLHEQLAAQPNIFMSTPKEPNFFSDESEFRRGLGWYFGLFEAAPKTALCGESSTHYTKLPDHPHTVARLKQHVPDAKFIYVMRHPIDRLVSHYIHAWTERWVDVPLHQAVTTYRPLIDYGRYAMQLEPYFEAFGSDRVLPVFFDRLRAHPQAELERIWSFIGATGTPTWQDLGPQNVSAERLRRNPVRDFIVNAPVLSTIRRRLVPKSVRERVKSLWMMRERPKLSQQQRERLAAAFDPDLRRLGSWLGVDLNCENFTSQTRDAVLSWGPETPSSRTTAIAGGG